MEVHRLGREHQGGQDSGRGASPRITTGWYCRAVKSIPDKLRIEPKAVAFVTDFFNSGKPIGAICHGPWMLVEAGVLKKKTLTSWPSIRTDIRNAGGHWVDEEVVRMET